ncbi:MAG: YezD family protein [Solibacillus sp.]
MTKSKDISETIEKIKDTVASVKYGTVTLVIQDGHVVQIEKNEKIRLK